MHCLPLRDRRLLWRSPSLQSQRTFPSTAGPDGTTGLTRTETAKTPGRRPSSPESLVEVTFESEGSAGSQSERSVADAAGPDTFSFEALLRLLASSMGVRARLVQTRLDSE